MKWFIFALKNWNDFSGRTSRSQFWWYVLFAVVFGWLASFISQILGLIYYLVLFVPGLAIVTRRLHDTDRSALHLLWMLPGVILGIIGNILIIAGKYNLLLLGWYKSLLTLSGIGAIVLLVFCLLDSQPDENKYGSNPKGLEI